MSNSTIEETAAIFEQLKEIPTRENKGRITLKLGKEHTFAFCSEPTSTSPSRQPILTFAEQVKMVTDLLVGFEPRALTRCLERSSVELPNIDRKISLGDAADLADQASIEAASRLRRQPSSFDAMLLYGSDLEGSLRDSSVDLMASHKRFIQNNWLKAAAHTGSLESTLLMIDNVAFVEIASSFDRDPMAIVTYSSSHPSGGGSLSNGLRSVVYGAETTSPQGFIQGGSLLAREYTKNAQLIFDDQEDTQQILRQSQIAAAKGLVQSCDSLSTLKCQVRGRDWEDCLISEPAFDRIQEMATRLRQQNHLPDNEYAQLVSTFMSKMGEEILRYEEPKPSSSPSPGM